MANSISTLLQASSTKGPSSNSIADIISQLEDAQNKANDANLARYNEGLSELQTGRDSMRNYFAQAGSLIQDIGASAVEDINRGSQRSYALGKQGLISSGLTNTTIMGSLIRGTEEDRRREMERVDEQKRVSLGGLSERQASAELGASGSIASFIAARDDTGPNVGQYASLIQQAAAAPQGKVQAQLGASGLGGGGGKPGGFGFGERVGPGGANKPASIVQAGRYGGQAPGQASTITGGMAAQQPQQSEVVKATLYSDSAQKKKQSSRGYTPGGFLLGGPKQYA